MSIPQEADPLVLFQDWLAEAQACEAIDDHTAMTLATCDADGAPSAQWEIMVLVTEDGHEVLAY